MKIIAIITLLCSLNGFAEKPKDQPTSKAHLLKVDLTFVDKDNGIFIVTVTNVSSEI